MKLGPRVRRLNSSLPKMTSLESRWRTRAGRSETRYCRRRRNRRPRLRTTGVGLPSIVRKAVVVAQFKYSNRLKTTPFRASDAKETICKFASAYRTHKRKYGAKKVRDKLQFELITNRPVFAALNKAIKGAASGGPLTGDAKKQASQLETASKLTGKELMEFAGKLRITGLAGSVRRNKRELSRVLADWSIAPDAMARARCRQHGGSY